MEYLPTTREICPQIRSPWLSGALCECVEACTHERMLDRWRGPVADPAKGRSRREAHHPIRAILRRFPAEMSKLDYLPTLREKTR